VRRRITTAALGAVVVLAAGCGGGARQDAHEPSGTFKVDVVGATFPAKQRLARQERMTIAVRNADTRTIPNLAVTVDSFSTREDRPDLADPNRPVWIVDAGPRGGATAYTNTWSLGAVRPGQTRTFTWRVTPVSAGAHKVSYRVAAGLNGKAKAQLAGGKTPEGSFDVAISRKPAQARVDPATGAVIRSGN
jgi:hypothetical protein